MPSVDQTATTASTSLQEIIVNAQRRGYREDTASSVGPFTAMPLLDAPYSINVTSGDLIENRNAHTLSEALKTNPTVATLLESNGYSSLSRVMIRGFTAADQDEMRDGMTDRGFTFPPIENVQRIEVLNGLSGFLYGFSEVGGTINYVTKDPVLTPMAEIATGVYGGGLVYDQADLGGPIDPDKRISYRLIAYREDGDTYIHDGTQHRLLVSGVVNFQFADDTSLKGDFYHQDYSVNGLQTYFSPFSLNGAAQVPSAFDATRQYGQPSTFNDSEKDLAGLRFQSKLNETLTLRAGYRYGTMSRRYDYVDAFLTAAPGVYSEKFTISPQEFEYTNTAYALVDADFDTGWVHHELTFGYSGTGYEFLRGNDASEVLAGPSDVGSPANLPIPSVAGYRDVLTTDAGQFLNNYLIGDRIVFDPAWSALIGVNYAQIRAYSKTLPAGPQTLTPTTGNTYNYTQGLASPSVALIFKPASNISLYASYMQGLAAGGTAPATFTYNNVTKPVVNANEMLSPSTSEQYEVGAKADIEGVYLTAALFRIDVVNTETDPADFVYKQDGREVHEGLEATGTGKITDRLTFVGGLTWMHAVIESATAAPLTNGKIPINVPDTDARAYFEYALPWVQNLTVSLGANYYGRRPVDALNTGFLQSATTVDTGLRYQPVFWGRQTSFDLTVSNLFDKSYWSFFRSGDGMSLGMPRAVAFSAKVGF